jgi:SOS-response transcriptional repressor LexA
VEVSDDTIIEEAVRLVGEGLCVTLPVNGHSMLPFIIGGKESVILQKPAQSENGDVVLAWVNGCRYVVHRIIAIEGDAVTLMGDGNLSGTEHCTLQDIKAKVTHVIGADERPHDLYCRWRRVAARLWWYLRPVRRYLLAIYRRVKR